LATLACVINGTAPDIVAGAPGTKFSEGQWTGTAVLSWKPAPEWLVYASASKGYKAGGFNLDYSALDRPCSTTAGSDAQDAACVALLARPANTPGNARPEASDLQFASEKVDAYELGVKEVLEYPEGLRNIAITSSTPSTASISRLPISRRARTIWGPGRSTTAPRPAPARPTG